MPQFKPWALLVTTGEDNFYYYGTFPSKESALAYLTAMLKNTETLLDICRIRVERITYA